MVAVGESVLVVVAIALLGLSNVAAICFGSGALAIGFATVLAARRLWIRRGNLEGVRPAS